VRWQTDRPRVRANTALDLTTRSRRLCQCGPNRLPEGTRIHTPHLAPDPRRHSNHVHLLITPERADAVSRLYKSSLIQAETYLLSCQCYIELNPVRAAMVDDPAHYRWTSYRHNALGQSTASLTPHPLYQAMGRNAAERQAAYRDLFRAQLDSKAIDDIRPALNQSQPLGDSRFYAKREAMTGQRREAKPRGRPRVQHDESAEKDVGQRKLGL